LWTAIDWLRGRFAATPAPHAPATARTVTVLADGTRVDFDHGSFDAWCVYVTRPGQPRHAPRDADYFTTLRDLHEQFPRLHEDFVAVFSRTTAQIDPALIETIGELASHYPPAVRIEVHLLLATLYAAMIAEENREHAPLGKRIKRLGVHQVLVEGWPVETAAHFSRGKPWRELDALCRARGF
jgi:hypothetical protein